MRLGCRWPQGLWTSSQLELRDMLKHLQGRAGAQSDLQDVLNGDADALQFACETLAYCPRRKAVVNDADAPFKTCWFGISQILRTS